ncbi:hypothetical protein [Nocardiopsis trehalosi]|uniref:hypothetical protein n=1 Tax=Nocardiopsis trehalosi TaxID=109329 RepID=UPI000A84118A|nr:hypothetical protein [Nocardiopsis trehalosi]
MDTGLAITLAVVAVLIVAVVVAVAVVLPRRRSRRLRERFGPEYDRALEARGDRRAAEKELARREKRHARLHLRPLSDRSREEYATGWARAQERFVDAPAEAVRDADELLTRLMIERGYPTEGTEQRIADLSVEHAGTIDRYRSARDISERGARGEASTEDLRNAMVHYRALFAELLEDGASAAGRHDGRTGGTRAADPRTPAAPGTPADHRETTHRGAAHHRGGPAAH